MLKAVLTPTSTSDASHAAHDETTVRVQVQALLDSDPALTQVAIARASGVNQARLNQFLKCAYKGDNAVLTTELARWLNLREQRQAAEQHLPVAPGWQPLPTTEKIMACLRYAHLSASITVVYGGAGIGKTLTCAHYVELHPNVWHIEMSRWDKSLGECLQAIADAMGLRNVSGAAHIGRELVRRLRGSGGLLIIDEAQHLTLDALEGLRAIHDQAGVGLALVGNESVYGRLTGGQRAAEFAQLYRRVSKRQKLTRAHADDVAQLVAAWGIHGGPERAFLTDIAAKPGALGGMTEVLKLASLLAGGADQPFDLNHLRAAWDDLGARQ